MVSYQKNVVLYEQKFCVWWKMLLTYTCYELNREHMEASTLGNFVLFPSYI